MIKQLAVAIFTFFLAFPTLAAEPQVDLEKPVLLLAKPELGGGYQKTVIVAVYAGMGMHVGYIINRPTPIKMKEIFPEHAPSAKVKNPVYFGGPFRPGIITALVPKGGLPAEDTLPIAGDIVSVIKAETVDKIIETNPNGARFFSGYIVWKPGELEEELKQGAWHAENNPSKALIFSTTPATMWEDELKKRQRSTQPTPRNMIST